MCCVLGAVMVFSLSLCAQTESVIKQEANKFAEFGSIRNPDLAETMRNFSNALKKDPDSLGYVVNYGTQAAIRARRSLMVQSMGWRKDYGGLRIMFVDGPTEPKIRTVIWIVPPGVDLPKIEGQSVAKKVFEGAEVSESNLKNKFKILMQKVRSTSQSKAYIINYGTNEEITRRENIMNSVLDFRSADPARVSYIRVSDPKIKKTELWFVPFGAQEPVAYYGTEVPEGIKLEKVN